MTDFGSGRPGLWGVVHLWSLDGAPLNGQANQDIEGTIVRECVGLLEPLRALLSSNSGAARRVWVATRGAQFVDGRERHLALSAASLWGLSRSLAAEHGNSWGALIDLDPLAPPEVNASALWREVRERRSEDQIAFRGDQRWALRLTRARSLNGVHAPSFRPDGSYLLTGGLGGLGLTVAGWMVANGARRLILLGRTSLPPRTEWGRIAASSDLATKVAAIRALESQGASVHLAAVDVADPSALRAFLESYGAEGWPPIRGVIHTAGLLHHRAALEEDREGLTSLLRAKSVGAWLLHVLLRDAPLDFFVCFSSAASVLASPLLGGYAAANAFLDALAHQRHLEGRPALTINWGLWTDVGMATRFEPFRRGGRGPAGHGWHVVVAGARGARTGLGGLGSLRLESSR